jgi:hypothetical protein
MFHYSNNLGVTTVASAIKIAIWFIILAFTVQFVMLIVGKFRPSQAANASIVLLFCLLYYGLAFEQINQLDFITVEHYSLIPFLIFLSIYFIKIILRLNPTLSLQLWKTTLFIVFGLIFLNLIPIIYVNMRLLASKTQNNSLLPSPTTGFPAQNLPDIYYIIFDEMAAFDVTRQYFGYDNINEFVGYLDKNGFYIAENSHSNSTSTLHEIARRLNYEDFPFINDMSERNLIARQRIQNNRAMQYLKSQGYTTIVFADDYLELSAIPPVDITYKPPDNYQIKNHYLAMDQFIVLVLKNTIILPWIQPDIVLPSIEHNKQMMLFTINKMPSLETSSPKFVYIHLLIPHWPFLFDQSGNLNDIKDFYNWDKYIGYYIYSLDVATTLLDGIISSSNPNNPPVIVFQSDHGARNSNIGNKTLQDYPEEYQTRIVNTFLLPGCADAPLTQDMDAINTLPIIFNCYFDAGIPLK